MRSGSGHRRGRSIEIDGFNVATALDEEQLTAIADVTDGTYNRAGDAATLERIYESVDLQLARVERQHEVTALFAAAGGLVLALGSLLSIAWFGRVI